LEIYPNPSIGVFYVKSDGRYVYEIEICDLLGQLVKREKISMQKEVEINLSDFSAGTYFVKIKMVFF
jgi:hypothetical protein